MQLTTFPIDALPRLVRERRGNRRLVAVAAEAGMDRHTFRQGAIRARRICRMGRTSWHNAVSGNAHTTRRRSADQPAIVRLDDGAKSAYATQLLTLSHKQT